MYDEIEIHIFIFVEKILQIFIKMLKFSFPKIQLFKKECIQIILQFYQFWIFNVYKDQEHD